MTGYRRGSFFRNKYTGRVARIVSFLPSCGRCAIATIDGGLIFTDIELIEKTYEKISMRIAMRQAKATAS